MLYINQLDYPDIPYYHNADNGGPPPGRTSVKTSGCGLCCACMVIEHLTMHKLELTECVKLSEENGANRNIGTSMKVLGKLISEKFDLDFSMTSSKEELISHLQNGGEAIANVAEVEGKTGLFTHRGHYITLISTDGENVCILDPSYKEGKFDEEGRAGRVKVCAPFIYCPVDTLLEETQHRDPGFYLFKRKEQF